MVQTAASDQLNGQADLLSTPNPGIKPLARALRSLGFAHLKRSIDKVWSLLHRPAAGTQTGCALALALIMSLGLTTGAAAQGGDLRSGGLNPFPKNDIYRLHIVGDWLMDSLKSSLRSSLKTLPRVQFQDEKIGMQSLRRSSWDEPVKAIRNRSASTDIDIAIVMFGLSEIGSLYAPGQSRQRFGSEAWLKRYARRIDSVMKALKADRGAVYWLGLPIVRRRDQSDSLQLINTLARERAYANGVTFIDVYARFQGENGGFNRYGPDLDGTIKLMRTKDGVYFTATGYAKIAHLVLQAIRRDLNRVKSERVVSLAGSETEQKTVRRAQQAVEARRKRAAAAGAKKKTVRQPPGGLPGGTRFGGQKADNSSFEFSTVVNNKPAKIKLDLPRPALSAAIIALVTRNQSKDKPARFGDNAVQIASGGVPLLSTVTPADESALALRGRRLSPTQSVFFKVWGKGERLPPKPGRADDFQWPRPAPKPVVHVRAKSASAAQPRFDPSALRRRRDPNLPPLPERNPLR